MLNKFPRSAKARCELVERYIKIDHDDMYADAERVAKQIMAQESYLSDYHEPEEPAIVDGGFSNFYGNISLYRLWIGNKDTRVPFCVPHSFLLAKGVVTRPDTLPGKMVLVYSYPLLDEYITWRNKLLRRPLITVPPPMSVIGLIRDCYGIEDRNRVTRKGRCAFFLSHSTKHIGASYSIDDVAGIVARLRREYNEIVCVAYYLDLPLSESLCRLFDKVICCGEIEDPLFMVRLYGILKTCECISYNKLGGAALHAASLGKRIIHFNSYVKPYFYDKDASKELIPIPEEILDDKIIRGYWSHLLAELSHSEGQDISGLLKMLVVGVEEGKATLDYIRSTQHSLSDCAVRQFVELLDLALRFPSKLKRILVNARQVIHC